MRIVIDWPDGEPLPTAARILRDHVPANRKSQTVRDEFLRLYDRGHAIMEIADHLGLCESTAKKWVKQYVPKVQRRGKGWHRKADLPRLS
ncbi:helix-turn-helix domain-containing protein [Rhodopseudomonas palustris]